MTKKNIKKIGAIIVVSIIVIFVFSLAPRVFATGKEIVKTSEVSK